MPIRLKNFRHRFLVFGSICSITALSPAISAADLPDADYQAAHAAAEKKVARTKARASRGSSLNSHHVNALSTSLIRNLFGRVYKVGDRWEVASWSASNTMARMTDDPEKLALRSGRTALFRYEVVSVAPAPSSEVTIQVTQLEGFGLKALDPRVKSLQLRFDDTMAQSRKTYEMTDSKGNLVRLAVSPDAMHSAITGLELFPLDVPELVTAESTTAPDAIPTLPDGLRAVASQAGYRPDLSRASSFRQDDFFGRGVQAIWQKGDPWPAYLKTHNGVSILISKGAS
jgi:hypothetical protein